MRATKNQRGYTLIEIGLVMIVVAFISGLLFNIYEELHNDRQVNAAKAHMEDAKRAIIAYAVTHSSTSYRYTAPPTVVENDAAVVVTVGGDVEHIIPAGRPYLPCPDIDNDGKEDRVGLPAAATVLMIDRTNNNTEDARGACWRSKGWLPWHTLDLPPADPWGNRYTYRVGINFSSALFGFNQDTRSDQGSYTKPLTVSLVAGHPFVSRRSFSIRRNLSIPLTLDAAQTDIAALWEPSTSSGKLRSTTAPSVICESSSCGRSISQPLIAGTQVTAIITLKVGGFTGDKVLPVYQVTDDHDIIEGLPVVIVSHGPNGYGALRSDTAHGRLSCNSTELATDEEIQNAILLIDQDEVDGCPKVLLTAVDNQENGFIVQPRASDGFDDVVAWMSRRELVSELNALGALPADPLPRLGAERVHCLYAQNADSCT